MGSLAKPGTVSIVPLPKVEDIELEHDHDDCKLSLNHCIAAGQSTRACFHDYRDCLTRGKHKQDKTLVTTKPVMGSLAKPGTVSIVPLPKVEVEEIEVEPEYNQEDEEEKETDDEGWEYVDQKHLIESQKD